MPVTLDIARLAEARMNGKDPTMDMQLAERDPAQGRMLMVRSAGQPTLDPVEARLIDAWWRAANYLSVGQIYLYDNPLLREPLTLDHVKPIVVGHWGTTPGQTFIYAHLNRAIVAGDLDMIYIAGPGHGGPALVGSTWLEGSYSEIYPDVSRDEAGMKRLFNQFSFPGGISSHVAPTTPGSIHEGGELGYSLSHAFGAAFDNPALIVACVIGDGEAETGPLATSWHSNKFLNPVTDGAVLPILHLNGYKINNPTILARIDHAELECFLVGCGWAPLFVEGDDPAAMHQAMARAVDTAIAEIQRIQDAARLGKRPPRQDYDEGGRRPRWPMIVLRSPKGWTGPKVVDGLAIEGTCRAHQVPLLVDPAHPDHVALLEAWMKSYRPEELFDADGRLMPEIAALAPKDHRRMGANPHANGGLLLHDLHMPEYRDHAVALTTPGSVTASDMGVLGGFLRDVVSRNQGAGQPGTFRVFGPDETTSNMLGAIFEVTDRQWEEAIIDNDQCLAPKGRVLDSMLSEHQCEGWLEGYLLTGRHGVFASYEAFVRIVDSMASQHAKWLKVCAELPWRRSIASLNFLLASHVWQQDHNGYTHQDPGFLDHVLSKKAGIARAFLPPDSNCLLAVVDHCLRSRDHLNVVVAGKHVMPQWLSIEAAVTHCAQGIGIWKWASSDWSDDSAEPDLIMACCGDTPTLEVLAAVMILRAQLPEIRVRVINVVDLVKLQPIEENPHGLNDRDFDSLFTRVQPVIFAFHGYPGLIRRLTFARANRNLHVHGYCEEGTITTPFDIRVQNGLDRFHLVIDAVDQLPHTGSRGAWLAQTMRDKLATHTHHIARHGLDLPEILDWAWTPAA
ncbi:phosphoketolase [Novosphingobium sp. Fuku2-ISO-50]|uniref:phosphoketolase family protein n=1 Tax=Novosphingobium sp. Fuku2-ISO-50 TaxID=1739114 RepID=UPI000A47C5C9|nr:phosphoketolase family protein [Novosphingobium sp. Fuku2-ISO-50]